MNMKMPLRYRISNWRQLPACQSNNSRDLKLRVTEFIQDCRLQGLRILLEHKDFGVLFACVVNAQGSLLSEVNENMIQELTTDEILKELAKYGFLITYHEYEALTGDQIQYLMTINQLGFDKIRLMNVWDYANGEKQSTLQVVAFNISLNPQWLNAGYCPSREEFTKALNNGSAINVSATCKDKNFRWDWLYNWVADINDVIADNAGKLSRTENY